VIISCVNGTSILQETLAALEGQEGRNDAEIIVVDRTGDPKWEAVVERFPAISWLHAAKTVSIPGLRAQGLAVARGEIVAFLEDHCLVTPGWLAENVAAHQRLPHTAISGCVENAATERAHEWAFYFCEYAAFCPPVQEGESGHIAGNCASYKRNALESVGFDAQRWEFFLHRRLLERGDCFYCNPRLRVQHKLSLPFREMLAQRFHLSRSFAAMRRQEATLSKRIVYGLGAPLLPPLLLGRITRTVLTKQGYRRQLVRAYAPLCALLIAWAFGELIGYWFGAGASLRKVR
jgi:GT2 family glycosyltransferase